ncbi:membrane protein insertase YidC [uncultured Phocaeicola sp.]|jgi:YidC/Oxa1 family membrane protein insertase|uniref:membrane protein insertase YidC n=1 Tax=uncultured Phocaeicola sp. TaxID=990718 RepID=UPI0025866D57|nr:membrane protein insertase YidC [uncultured Phocaeicola sp.]
MDKNTLVGFALIGAVVIGFSIYNRPSQEEMARAKHYQDSIQAIAQKEAAMQEQAAAQQSPAHTIQADSTSLLYGASQGTEQLTTLENDLVKVTFTNKGGRVCAAMLKDYNGQDGKPLDLFDEKDSGMNFAFEGKNENILTEDLYFQPTNVTDTTVTMRLTTNGAGYIDFDYKLLPNTYVVNFSIRANGMQNFFPAAANTVNINWHQRARQLEKGFSFEQRYTSLTYKPVNKGSDYLSEMKDAKEEVTDRLDWIAFKNQFFSSVLIADQDFDKASLVSTPQKEGSGYMKNYTADMTTFFDPTGKQATNMQFYFGPNRFKTLLASNDLSLSQKDLELEDLVYLGWPIIRWINRWFTIPLFDWLSGWGLSMGIVLLLMTIIVKALVYPATHKSYMSSAKMRVLKPYINEINAKYPKKEDALKKQQETMALYSKYGVSPMGGCLPMLIQMPVFMALFFFVPNAIELRQQSFLWAPDMSTYDDIIHWSTTIPLLGNHLSLFCLLFSITNILNTVYTMKQQDTGQQQMPGMKLMMYIMPVMFIFIFNGYSSGLNYYYFISGLIGILTMVILRKTTDEKKLLAQLEANKEKKKQKNGGKAGGGLMAKLEALQKEQERLQQERMNKGKK